MTDNAFAYIKCHTFKPTLTKLGARHVTTRPYRPRQGQGQALHPDRAPRMASTAGLRQLRRSRHRPAALAALVQSPPPTRRRHPRLDPSSKAERPPWQQQLAPDGVILPRRRAGVYSALRLDGGALLR
jgi:hypothetical protein